ncbi:tetratricopeptide repeat protein [Paraburkholderia megapolitana]|uniref:Tetratricopeptide (TPR) repeat n=1 Tax=Paraburkholderia megapolitana TaxID=420953 RepID=A0A1I3DG09_9BURK|nr:tetratricopeptide repeat protein [Paraburkholderia megapolitana]QDQ81823.1 tetratricopeptide repeat protein [Paraburkholderia megapolitana]SFH85665.1 Tetratricopeptide (TPR) repeat [Paraburkholderia megapolitana]
MSDPLVRTQANAQSQSQPTAFPFAPGPSGGAMRAAVDDALRNARTRLEQNDLVSARRLYEGVLTMAPDNIEALHLCGLVCLRQGDAVRAEPLIARSMHLGLRQPWNFANHAAALVGVGRHHDALAVTDAALKLDAVHPAVNAARGDALLGLERFDEAIAAYDAALQRAPGQPTAWSRRGAALRSLGRPADALISLDRALKIDSGDPATHIERGHTLRALERRDEALHHYQLATVVCGKTPALLHDSGVVLTEMGRATEALAVLDEGLKLAPHDKKLLYASCVALDQLHLREELLQRADRLLALDRNSTAAWVARGNALLGLDRHAEAAQAYSEALAHTPEHVDASRNCAAALRSLGRFEDALEHYERALSVASVNPELLYNRAVTLQQLGRYDEALTSHAEAARAPAETAQGLYTRAVALQQLGEHETALRDYERACERDPHHGAARRSEAYCRLLMGDFEKGWKQHEARWNATDVLLNRRHADRPLWLGAEPVAGKTVLLHAEQGYGDTLQFCRYASLVQAQGATVILEVPAGLAPLLGSLHGVSRIVSEADSTPAFDLQCPLMSLPLAFRTTLDTVPAETPYLLADAERREIWVQRVEAIAKPRRLKVGLAWSGNPRHNNDENRSLPFAALAPLLALDATFVCLQPQVRERDREALAASGVVSFGDVLADFADTAALVETLDLVISVDTSVVHLAGATGRPVWVLLPRAPDWRWLLEREDSPWYPTARLFRQTRPGDWPDVIGRVRDALIDTAQTHGYPV